MGPGFSRVIPPQKKQNKKQVPMSLWMCSHLHLDLWPSLWFPPKNSFYKQTLPTVQHNERTQLTPPTHFLVPDDIIPDIISFVNTGSESFDITGSVSKRWGSRNGFVLFMFTSSSSHTGMMFICLCYRLTKSSQTPWGCPSPLLFPAAFWVKCSVFKSMFEIQTLSLCATQQHSLAPQCCSEVGGASSPTVWSFSCPQKTSHNNWEKKEGCKPHFNEGTAGKCRKLVSCKALARASAGMWDSQCFFESFLSNLDAKKPIPWWHLACQQWVLRLE